MSKHTVRAKIGEFKRVSEGKQLFIRMDAKTNLEKGDSVVLMEEKLKDGSLTSRRINLTVIRFIPSYRRVGNVMEHYLLVTIKKDSEIQTSVLPL